MELVVECASLRLRERGSLVILESINKFPLLLLWCKFPIECDSKCRFPLLLVCPKLPLKDWLASLSSVGGAPRANDFRDEAKRKHR